ncbi:glycosyltransferase [uncultured Psychroserpens sp.]|uniref:glycosyltransferase n=1 Tax=uncultured Psychroserpens sp. TaxID=255436 RepID=UPI0026211225|nr:glycosyltransferase [uncultured Psychroserpens sp.]
MKILLVGEFNRSHKFLKQGLEALQHSATVVSLQDGFKKVDTDIVIKHHYESKLLRKLHLICFKLFNIDLHSLSVKKQIKKLEKQLSGYDIVQFINESSFSCTAETELKIFDLLHHWNKKSFLLSTGCDYPSVLYAYQKKFKYSILTPYFENRVTKKKFRYMFKYINDEFSALHHHMYKSISGVISCDLDYTIPLEDHPKHLGLIPHPINIDAIKFLPLNFDNKIVIFHGINRQNYHKKGNDFFEEALKIVLSKYADKIEIITLESVPYHDYIAAFDNAHIVLDQVYSYDQGYNALEAMAKGKVVFTGAEQEWLDYYGIEEDTVAINALPNVTSIADKLEWLIKNPNEIKRISKNARQFVEDKHHYIKCSEQFLSVWNDT